VYEFSLVNLFERILGYSVLFYESLQVPCTWLCITTLYLLKINAVSEASCFFWGGGVMMMVS
jgi:hypothetical protein